MLSTVNIPIIVVKVSGRWTKSFCGLYKTWLLDYCAWKLDMKVDISNFNSEIYNDDIII